MRKILASLLLVAFTLQCFYSGFVVLGFYANQKYISARLCENRDRPMLHCNGKCILAKKIMQEKTKDRENPERKAENKIEIISLNTFFAAAIPVSTSILNEYFSFSDKKLAGNPSDIFHPPGATS